MAPRGVPQAPLPSVRMPAPTATPQFRRGVIPDRVAAVQHPQASPKPEPSGAQVSALPPILDAETMRQCREWTARLYAAFGVPAQSPGAVSGPERGAAPSGNLLGPLLDRGGATRGTVGPTRLVLIHDQTSPRTYRFAMKVPAGGRTLLNADGSATVVDARNNPVTQVGRPWAFDAAARPQKTWYTVADNGDLIQHVSPAPNALFPILADPTQQEYWDAVYGVPPIGPYTSEEQQQITTIQQYEQENGPQPRLYDIPGTAPTTQPENSGLSDLLDPNATPAPPQDTSAAEQYNPLVRAEVQNQTPDNPGLSDLLDPSATTPDTEPRSPLQGPTPAPGQRLGIDDWYANNLFGKEVGVVNSRPGPDGTPQYYRVETNPDGTTTERITTTARVGKNGDLLYVFDDGSILDPDVAGGISSITRYDNAGVSTTEFSNGEILILRPDFSGTRILPGGNHVNFRLAQDANGSVVAVDEKGKLLDLSTTLGLLATATISAHASHIEALATSNAVKGWNVPAGVGSSAVRWTGRALGPLGAVLGAEMDAGTGTSRGQAYTQNFAGWGVGAGTAVALGTLAGVAFAPAAIIGIGAGIIGYVAVKQVFRWLG